MLKEKELSKKDRLEFRGGTIMGALPMAIFIVWAITFSLLGLGNESVFIIGMIIALTIGLFFCKSGSDKYIDTLVAGMTQSIGIIAILAYYWAGMFSQVLRAGGFVDGLIWLGFKTGVTGGIFVGIVFVLASLFGTATGTAYGTITTFCLLVLPAGVTLGGNPLYLIGAIISGGILGDNLAPISDTTIISATTQEADIPGVVKSRFKYTIAAAIPALIMFIIFGGSGQATQNSEVLLDIQSRVGPSGLIFIIPFIIVLFSAFRGSNLITSLTRGIVSAIVLLLIMGFPLSTIVSFNMEEGVIGGALIDGISGYFALSIMLLFILAGSQIMEASGFMDAVKKTFTKVIKGSVRRAEGVIYLVTALASVLITHNAASGITVSSFVRGIGKEYNIHPYRRANLLDSLTSSLAGIIPWGGHIILAVSTVAIVANEYDFISNVSPVELTPYIFYGLFLPIVMLIAIITGWGLEFSESKDEVE